MNLQEFCVVAVCKRLAKHVVFYVLAEPGLVQPGPGREAGSHMVTATEK